MTDEELELLRAWARGDDIDITTRPIVQDIITCFLLRMPYCDGGWIAQPPTWQQGIRELLKIQEEELRSLQQAPFLVAPGKLQA